MMKWVFGVLVLAAVGLVLSQASRKSAGCPECAVPVALAPAAAPSPPPAPTTEVVDVVDLTTELSRPVAEKPFVPFD